MTDDVWKRAPSADTFWISQWQRRPSDDTRVHVLYDDRALYFAVLCFDEKPELVRALQITPDADPGLDDRITIEIDPFHNHRSISRFTVTARGTQSDVRADGRAQKAAWKGMWRAAARKTSSGWTAEIEIPLEILPFDPSTGIFGINFVRFQHRTGEWSEWANLTPQRLPEEAGHLSGLELPQPVTPARRVAIMQYVSGNARPHARLEEAGRLGTGLDVRYQWRSTMTSMVSIRPDFTDIDADVPGVGFSYNEKFISDHRPFFQEGAAFFGNRAIFHSGRVETFDVGIKTFGRLSRTQVGLLATHSEAGRSDYVGRAVREIGSSFNLSATLAGTEREMLSNNTVQLSASGRLGRHVHVEGDVAHSETDGRPGDGGRTRGAISYKASHWYSGGWVERTAPDYFPANGFIASDIPGTAGVGAYGGYNRTFGDGWFRKADASLSYDMRDTTSGLRQREVATLNAGTQTASHIQLSAGMTIGSYRPRGTEPGEWQPVVNDDRYYLASAYYQSPTGEFGYGAQYSWGSFGADQYESIAPSLWIAPGSHLSLAYSFERANHADVQLQHVFSGTWEIDPEQALSARWVDYDGGYYRVSYRRMLAERIDALGVYTTDPYDPGTFNVKLVWTLAPRQTQ